MAGFFSFFPCFKYIIRSLLAYKVSVEKSANGLMGFSLYIASCFPLVSFKILFLSLTFDNLITVHPSVGLFGFIFGTVGFLDLGVYFFPQVRKFSAITYLNKLSAPFSLFSFWGLYNACICLFDGVS